MGSWRTHHKPGAGPSGAVLDSMQRADVARPPQLVQLHAAASGAGEDASMQQAERGAAAGVAVAAGGGGATGGGRPDAPNGAGAGALPHPPAMSNGGVRGMHAAGPDASFVPRVVEHHDGEDYMQHDHGHAARVRIMEHTGPTSPMATEAGRGAAAAGSVHGNGHGGYGAGGQRRDGPLIEECLSDTEPPASPSGRKATASQHHDGAAATAGVGAGLLGHGGGGLTPMDSSPRPPATAARQRPQPIVQLADSLPDPDRMMEDSWPQQHQAVEQPVSYPDERLGPGQQPHHVEEPRSTDAQEERQAASGHVVELAGARAGLGVQKLRQHGRGACKAADCCLHET